MAVRATFTIVGALHFAMYPSGTFPWTGMYSEFPLGLTCTACTACTV